MKAVIGKLSRFWERFKEENPNLQVSIPVVGGLSTNIPLSEKGKMKSVRSGFDSNDKKSPFVQMDTEALIKYYSEYEAGKEYKFCRSPYAESVPLNINGKGFSYGKNVNDLQLVVISAKYTPPDHLIPHYQKSLELFKKIGKVIRDPETRNWENNKSVRISKFDLKDNVICIQPATYFDQIGTNLTMDWSSGFLSDDSTATIRNDIEKHDKNALPPLNSSILANTLGVAVVVLNPETKEVLIPIRGSEQAIMANGEGKFHCSASGVFEWLDVNKKGELGFDFFMQGMEKEIKSEIGLDRELYELIPLTFSRELVRGGKPQLFFVAETNMDISTIKNEMKGAEESWEFIDESDLPEGSQLRGYIENPLEAPQNMFTYEGWMAMKIALAYMYDIEPPFLTC
ncbi:hypothetical protein ACQUQP_14330 [Marinobacterium sp. YM272]|uniref:hypothetical protein n=1 Tax=Marinobacterium sp. YM272 TaxID=3421654 RepID=UPI003D7F7717